MKFQFAVKFLFAILFAAVAALTLTGLRGCQTTASEAAELEAHHVETNRFNQFDNVETIYHITCGKSGKISTSTGRQPVTWNAQTSGTTRDLNFVGILKVPDSSVSYIVGNSGTVLRSTNMGVNWSDLSISGNVFPNLYALKIMQPVTGQFTHIIAAGDSGKIVRSSTSAGNWVWQQFTVSPVRGLRTIITVSPIIWLAAGEQGSIFRTDNSGGSWTYINTSVTNTFNRLAQIRYDTYIVVGDGGKIFKSTNYGTAWVQKTSGTTKDLNDVYFKNSNEGIAVGDDGTSRYTTNGGESWVNDPFLSGITTKDILSISEVDSVTSISAARDVTADNNSALGTTFIQVSSDPFIGIEPVSEIIPGSFSLGQNYPNPFNPVTKISFDIPRTSGQNVKLTVFDITGKVLEVIVNENLGAGKYEAEWNAGNHSSGIYFYRIQAGDFSETKKMILVK